MPKVEQHAVHPSISPVAKRVMDAWNAEQNRYRIVGGKLGTFVTYRNEEHTRLFGPTTINGASEWIDHRCAEAVCRELNLT